MITMVDVLYFYPTDYAVDVRTERFEKALDDAIRSVTSSWERGESLHDAVIVHGPRVLAVCRYECGGEVAGWNVTRFDALVHF